MLHEEIEACTLPDTGVTRRLKLRCDEGPRVEADVAMLARQEVDLARKKALVFTSPPVALQEVEDCRRWQNSDDGIEGHIGTVDRSGQCRRFECAPLQQGLHLLIVVSDV